MTDAASLVEKIARAIQFPHVDDREALRLWKHASLLGSLEEQFLHSQARACLSAIEAAGMVIVPREPTKAMVDAGDEATPLGDLRVCGQIWAAMIAAAPKQS